jgi:hypothetical protein
MRTMVRLARSTILPFRRIRARIRVDLAHHHRFDGGQHLGHGTWRDGEGRAKLQRCPHVPADDDAARDP